MQGGAESKGAEGGGRRRAKGGGGRRAAEGGGRRGAEGGRCPGIRWTGEMQRCQTRAVIQKLAGVLSNSIDPCHG